MRPRTAEDRRRRAQEADDFWTVRGRAAIAQRIPFDRGARGPSGIVSPVEVSGTEHHWIDLSSETPREAPVDGLLVPWTTEHFRRGFASPQLGQPEVVLSLTGNHVVHPSFRWGRLPESAGGGPVYGGPFDVEVLLDGMVVAPTIDGDPEWNARCGSKFSADTSFYAKRGQTVSMRVTPGAVAWMRDAVLNITSYGTRGQVVATPPGPVSGLANWTDFSEYDTGEPPSNWTSTSGTVETDEGGLRGQAWVDGGGRRMSVEGPREILAGIRPRTSHSLGGAIAVVRWGSNQDLRGTVTGPGSGEHRLFFIDFGVARGRGTAAMSTFDVGDRVWIRVRHHEGETPIWRAKAWVDGQTEPGWMTDDSQVISNNSFGCAVRSSDPPGQVDWFSWWHEDHPLGDEAVLSPEGGAPGPWDVPGYFS